MVIGWPWRGSASIRIVVFDVGSCGISTECVRIKDLTSPKESVANYVEASGMDLRELPPLVYVQAVTRQSPYIAV